MAKHVNPFLQDDMPPFAGFPEDALKFFRALKKNNTREWFAENKARFDANVRGPMESLLAALAVRLQSRVPDLAIEPKKAIYRIYRDTRFSKDKTPYKTWCAASFSLAGQDRKTAPGYYFHFNDKELGIGGGLYAPLPAQLKALRAAIDRDPKPLLATVAEKSFKKLFGELDGEVLARVPQGYDKEHPSADLLRMKQYLCWVTMDPKIILDEDLLAILADHVIAMTPLVRWLTAHC
jgi:uncharacterized protein (TIGR02453 family)